MKPVIMDLEKIKKIQYDLTDQENNMRLKMNKILIFFYISFSISIAQRPITSEIS